MCDTRRYGLLDGNALVGRSRYEQNEVAARTRISLAAIKTRLQRARKIERTWRFLCSQEQNSCSGAMRPTSLNRSPGALARALLNSVKLWSSSITEAKRRAFWSSPVYLPKKMARA